MPEMHNRSDALDKYVDVCTYEIYLRESMASMWLHPEQVLLGEAKTSWSYFCECWFAEAGLLIFILYSICFLICARLRLFLYFWGLRGAVGMHVRHACLDLDINYVTKAASAVARS